MRAAAGRFAGAVPVFRPLLLNTSTPMFVGSVSVDVPGVLTIDLSGPDARGFFTFLQARFTTVPEPSTGALVGAAAATLAAAAVVRARRRSNARRRGRRAV